MFGPHAFIETSSPSHGVLGVRLRGGFERSTVSDVTNGTGTASFTWTFGTLDACPLEWRWRTFALPLCARIEGGELDGTGVHVTPALEAKRGWLAVAAVGRLRWAPIPHFSIELEGGPRAPLIRDHFLFEPSTAYYQPGPIGGLLGGDVRASF